jgi:predicted GTPase
LTDEYRGTAQGRQVLRLRYVTQVTTRPPTFAAFVSGAEDLSDNTTKFILNSLRAKFGFPGVPLRLIVRHKNAERAALKASGRKAISGTRAVGRRPASRGRAHRAP